MAKGQKQSPAARAARKAEIDERRRQVAMLLRARVQQQEIARQMHVDPATVSRDVKVIRAQWKKEYAGDYGRHVTDELAVLADDERRWRTEMVGLLRERVSRETTVHKDGSVTTVEIDIPPHVDMALQTYDRVLSVMRQRARLLGLDAPVKVAPTDPSGQKPYEPGVLSEDELRRRLAALGVVTEVSGGDQPG